MFKNIFIEKINFKMNKLFHIYNKDIFLIFRYTAIFTLTSLFIIYTQSNKDIVSYVKQIVLNNYYLFDKCKKNNEVEYFKSFLRPEFNVNFLDKSFYNSIDYLNNVNNVDFNWTSALPIFSPPTLVRKAGSSSFLLDDLHHYSPYNGHSELRKAIRKKFKKDGINAEEKNIIINTSIFEILEGFYSSLNWKNNDSILIPTPTSRNI